MNDACSQFLDAIRASGMAPPALIVPGKLYRFPGVGKRNGNTAGWCKLFDDGFGGCFGDWSSGLSCTWVSRQDWPISPHARSTLLNRIKAARAQAELCQQAKYAEAADRAHGIWDAAPVAPRHHPYLVAKGIEPHNARIHKRCLVLPVTTFAGSISSLQFIAPNGCKRLLSGGRKRDCFIAITGNEEHEQRVVICEGWATGCTLAEDDPGALVLAAIDAGNLLPVAVAARRRWPSAELVIAGDDDRLTPGNPGAAKAREAAIAAGALLAMPQWPDGAPGHLTDFNDLALWLAAGGT